MRYYIGVDWADQTHAVWVVDERGTKITAPPCRTRRRGWSSGAGSWTSGGRRGSSGGRRLSGPTAAWWLSSSTTRPVHPVNPKALDRPENDRPSGPGAFPRETADPRATPRYLLRDRDAVYGVVFSSRAQAMGDPRSQDGASVALAESVRGTPHRDPAPRVPRPHGGVGTKPICVACCATISSTTTVPERTSPWPRTPRTRDRWSALTKAGSSRPPWSEACIIATHARRRKIRPACGGTSHVEVGGRPVSAVRLALPPPGV